MTTSELKVLAKQYLNLCGALCQAVEARNLEAAKEVLDSSEKIKNVIMGNLTDMVFVVPVHEGGFVLRLHGQADRFISLQDYSDPKSVAKYLASVVPFGQATRFATEEEAKAKVEPVNEANFRSFLDTVRDA